MTDGAAGKAARRPSVRIDDASASLAACVGPDRSMPLRINRPRYGGRMALGFAQCVTDKEFEMESSLVTLRSP